jgi:hypothetical protein
MNADIYLTADLIDGVAQAAKEDVPEDAVLLINEDFYNELPYAASKIYGAVTHETAERIDTEYGVHGRKKSSYAATAKRED